MIGVADGRRPSAGAGGFSLIELVVSLVIGLVLVAGTSAVFVGSRQIFRTQESLAQVQETGRFLNFLLYPYVRQAGYLPDPRSQLDPGKLFLGDASPSVDIRRAIWGVDNVANTVAGVTSQRGTDVLVTRYFGQDLPEDPGDIEGQLKTCLGLPAGSSGLRQNQMAENVFFVRPLEAKDPGIGDAGIGSLSCRARVYTVDTVTGAITATQNLPAQPLILGIQDMQILYGIDADSDSAPNQYVVASAVPDWQQVVSVRITVSVAGGSPTDLSLGDTHDAASGKVLIAGGRIHRRFTTTLQIRNLLRT